MSIRDEMLERLELGLPSDDPIDAVRRGGASLLAQA